MVPDMEEDQPESCDEDSSSGDDGEESGVSEEGEAEEAPANLHGSKPVKRPHPEEEEEEEEPSGDKKKAKKLGKELFRPPTAEEMNQLRETENLFHSNLFRLQIDELLKEVAIKPKYKELFDIWMAEFKEFLSKLKGIDGVELNDKSWHKKKKVLCPVNLILSKFQGTFKFVAPVNVDVVGSYPLNCGLGPNMEIDIRIEIPQECLLRSDVRNQQYLLKRALYVGRLASALRGWEKVEDVRFSLHEGDPLKPTVRVVPAGKLGKHVGVNLLVTMPPEAFKLAQLAPEKNNVKSKWLLDAEQSEGVDPPTPHYNHSIAVDLVLTQNEELRLKTLEGHQALCEGIKLLKVWLKQRGLHQGYGSFSGFLMSMLVVQLVENRRLSALMSSYQVVRNTWNYLANADWTEQGISLAPKGDSALMVGDFHLLCDVVFLDVTGRVNLCGNMTKSTFLTVKKESVMALKCLDDPSINSFQALFMINMPFYRQYDHIISIKDCGALKKAEDRVSSPAGRLQSAGPWLARDAMVEVLRRGLGDRVSHLAVQLQAAPCWGVEESPPDPGALPLVLGLSLDTGSALRLLDKGPAANTPEATDFREFWGDKSELRRFRDGSICEAVVWPGGGVARRRLLCRDVVLHLARRHLGLEPSALLYVADQLDCVLANSTGIEGSLAVTKACDSLARQLMQLEDLPLSIASVQGDAACLRYADPFPPCARKAPTSSKPGQSAVCKASEVACPQYTAAIPVVLSLALSSKWPDDVEAIRRIKAAFYVKLAEVLSETCQLLTQPYPERLDVLKDGLVFRLRVWHAREVSLLKQTINPQGQLRHKDTEASLALEMACQHLPRLTAALHGLHMLHPAVGPASCLAKRWVAAHLLLDEQLMPAACVEMLVASLFLRPEPYQPPAQPQLAFMRFLELLAASPWHTEPLILNFNDEIPRSEVLELTNRFSSERASLPALMIATPDCRSGSTWTRHAPGPQVLHRLAQLARASLASLDAKLLADPAMDYKMVFRPPLGDYDVVVRLNASLTRRNEAVDVSGSEPAEGAEPHAAAEKHRRIPVVGLDLVQCYLRDLREAYEDYALFFYDRYGGRRIGVLYKPGVLQPQEFKVSHIHGQAPQPPKKMVFNVEAFLSDLRLMGEGLISGVEVKVKN